MVRRGKKTAGPEKGGSGKRKSPTVDDSHYWTLSASNELYLSREDEGKEGYARHATAIVDCKWSASGKAMRMKQVPLLKLYETNYVWVLSLENFRFLRGITVDMLKEIRDAGISSVREAAGKFLF